MALESRAHEILVGNIIPQVFATIFVVSRIITKTLLTKSWGSDDTMLSISWVASLSLTIMSCLETKYGAGMHIQDVSNSFLTPATKLLYGTLIVYNLVLCLTKISIGLFYLRVFRDRLSRYIAMGTMGFTVLYTIPLLLVSIFQCTPVRGVYDFSIKSKCINTIPSFYTSAACNILVDAILIFLVVYSVLPLKIRPKQKAVLLMVVSSGWLAVIASIIRVVRVGQVLHVKDKTWVSYDSSIWSAVEVDIGIFCTAAPSIKPLLRKLFPNLMATASNKLSSSHGFPYPHTKSRTANGGAFELNSQVGTTNNITSNKYWERSAPDNDSKEVLNTRQDIIMKSTSVKVDSEAISGKSRESLSSTEYVPA